MEQVKRQRQPRASHRDRLGQRHLRTDRTDRTMWNMISWLLICLIPVAAVILDKIYSAPYIVWNKKEIDKEV